jgi:hypothetical protein
MIKKEILTDYSGHQFIKRFRIKQQRYVFLFLTSLLLTGKAQAQKIYHLCTDRDMYVSGETLLAKIFLPEGVPSRIMWLDLVNEKGSRVTGVSLEIAGSEAEGYLQLPDSLSSGTYLLRTYQKYNAGLIKTNREIYISSRFDKLENASQIKRFVPGNPIIESQTQKFQIEDLKQVYSPKSKVESSIRIDDSVLSQLEGNLVITVAQTDSLFTSVSYPELQENAHQELVEKKGIIISGVVIDKKNSLPADGIQVYLTIPDSLPGFQYYKTAKNGRFYFLLDKYYGPVDAVVQCFGNTPLQRLSIKLDELYAETSAFPESKTQELSAAMKDALLQNISAVTFQKIFNQNYYSLFPKKLKLNDAYPYYGKATTTVDPRLFIDLPNFSEISRELLPGVKYRNYNNEPTLQVINSASHYYFEETPLILLDGIPVRDLNVIKDMGTADIDRVDICKNERYFGDLRFPGVVAIYSRKHDYSRLIESSQLIRLKIEAIQLPFKLVEPVMDEPSVPDMRQTLYWNPLVKPTANLAIQCNTSSLTGQFKLSVKGKLKDGTLISTEKHFEVK